MTKTENRKDYSEPKIERIVLDNEISLALESIPPVGPFEGYVPDASVQDPFKTNLA